MTPEPQPATHLPVKPLGLVLVAALGVAACSGADSPIGPSPPGPRVENVSPPDTRASIASFTVTGQLIAGRFAYWPRLVIATGATGMTVERIELRYPESSQAGPFSSGYFTMSHAVEPGRTFTFEHALMSAVAVSQLTAVVSFIDAQGRTGQLTASAVAPALVPGVPSPTLRIDAFTVTGFMERTSYAYWPKLTLTTSAGPGAVTVTRLQFELAGVGGTTPYRGTWRIPAQSTVQLFHGEFYGEPEFYLTSSSQVDEMSVLVSYVDDSGRSADVRAVATVAREPSR